MVLQYYYYYYYYHDMPVTDTNLKDAAVEYCCKLATHCIDL